MEYAKCLKYFLRPLYATRRIQIDSCEQNAENDDLAYIFITHNLGYRYNTDRGCIFNIHKRLSRRFRDVELQSLISRYTFTRGLRIRVTYPNVSTTDRTFARFLNSSRPDWTGETRRNAPVARSSRDARRNARSWASPAIARAIDIVIDAVGLDFLGNRNRFRGKNDTRNFETR